MPSRRRHPQWSADQPQTGERVTSHGNDVLIHTNYPDYPHFERGQAAGGAKQWAVTPFFTPIRLEGTGDLWFGQARMEYSKQGSFQSLAIFELKDDLVFRETIYYAQVFEPPQ